MTEIAKSERIWFWGLLALAVALRAMNFSVFAMHHPDEVLQYLEPAYRLLTGDGIVTWEYRYGMRSWLLPWLLAGGMALGNAFSTDPLAGIATARIGAAALGLIPVIAAWHLGRRTSTTHGIVAMAVMAVWYEQIVFSTHLLTESLATSLLLGSAALISRDEGRLRIIAAGALMTLSVILRFHYGLAAFVFVLLALMNDWKRWGWLIAGAIPVLLISGAVDVAMGQWPFQWIWTNVQLNVFEGRSARYGIEPPAYFLTAIWDQWGLLAIPIAILAVEAGEKYRPLLFAAVFNLAAHSLIAHKEYRFIELTIAALIVLAAIGSVNIWQRFDRQSSPHSRRTPAIAALLLAWAAASFWLGLGRPLDQWFGERAVGPQLAYAAGKDPRVCGMAGMMGEFWQLSRVYVGRPMPFFLLSKERGKIPRLKPPGAALATVNAVMAPPNSDDLLPGYSKAICKGEGKYRRCLYKRPGGCRPTPEADERELQYLLLREDS